MDLGGDWSRSRVTAQIWGEEILPKLWGFDSMTWGEIIKASGGRPAGTNHHFVKVENLSKAARDRLREIEQDDIEELFSLRLDAKKRIYGIQDRQILELLWYDPDHTVYSMKPR